MNFVAGILIVVACTYIGIGIDGYYKTKIAVLREFQDFIGYAMAEISFMKTDIGGLLSKYAERQSKLSEALVAIKNPHDNTHINLPLVCLTNGEKQLITDFIKGIATLDNSSQKAYAELYTAKVCAYADSLEQARNTKGKLAKKLAPLIGLGIMIIIL